MIKAKEIMCYIVFAVVLLGTMITLMVVHDNYKFDNMVDDGNPTVADYWEAQSRESKLRFALKNPLSSEKAIAKATARYEKALGMLEGCIFDVPTVEDVYAECGKELPAPAEKEAPAVEVVETYTASEDCIYNDFYLAKGDTVTVLSDESWSISNSEKGEFVFQPVDLGDWSYELSSADELERIMDCYLSMKNTGSF